ncbi:GNAT family N-acetyltransferase [Petrotoga sp. 9PWA.NaAc.5.4]|uniref:GNAT family N-acetyltransferase n=1 Tax=Petrotoga sp. 9PWA.NaAc.5.4 TaxID=1434328 RepID=UPI000CC5AA0B|nr:GNAT family N-acetyltransferase [Petrotoga sp. 9PWA.NaAc.5.4]PNR94754.1 acetyltransferase [Petrotoga sp. 9PWA.NaAc.5.4]
MEVLYRQATINDYDQMYNLWKNIEGMGLSDSDTKENIEKFLNKNQGLNYICEKEGKIIGTILCGEDGRRGYLYHLAVDKDYRRKGIGTKLVNLVFDNLKKKGIIKCHLFVYYENELGKTFWEKTGWHKRNELLIYSKDIE